jgi:uncharacterized peroxidase-related enzyme
MIYLSIDRTTLLKDERNTLMSRLTSVDPDQATGETRELLDATRRTFGAIPNSARVLASSPAALKTWLESVRALAGGQLDPGLRERIALGVAEANKCGYCLSAHTYVAKRVTHLSDEEIAESRRMSSTDPKVAAALKFAETVLERRGGVSDADVEEVRAAGYSDGEIAEIVTHVAFNVLTNYFNKVASPKIDFPEVAPSGKAA